MVERKLKPYCLVTEGLIQRLKLLDVDCSPVQEGFLALLEQVCSADDRLGL